MIENYLLQTTIREYGLRSVVLQFSVDVDKKKLSGELHAKHNADSVVASLDGFLFHEGDDDIFRLLYKDESGANTNLIVLRQTRAGDSFSGFYEGKIYSIIPAHRPKVVLQPNALLQVESNAKEFDRNPVEFAGALKKI